MERCKVIRGRHHVWGEERTAQGPCSQSFRCGSFSASLGLGWAYGRSYYCGSGRSLGAMGSYGPSSHDRAGNDTCYSSRDGSGTSEGSSAGHHLQIGQIAKDLPKAAMVRITELVAESFMLAFWWSKADGYPIWGSWPEPAYVGMVQKKQDGVRSLYAALYPELYFGAGRRIWLVALRDPIQGDQEKSELAAVEREIIAEVFF